MLAMLNTGLNTRRCAESVCEVPTSGGVLPLLVPGVTVGVCIDRCCVANRVKDMYSVLSATREMFSEDEGVEF